MKIAAAAVVLVMLASAMIIGISATQYDADGDGDANTPNANQLTYTVDLSRKDFASVILNSNIDYYYKLNGTVSVKFEAGLETGTLKEISETPTSILDSGGQVKISATVSGATEDTEEKRLMVTLSKEDITTLASTVYVKATVTVTIGGVETVLDSITYTIKIISSSVVYERTEKITFVKDVYSAVNLRDLTYTKKTYSDNTAEQAQKIDTKYRFYGLILPEGLSITSEGVISGIAKNITTENIDFTATLLIEDPKTGETGSVTINIKISDFGYKVYADTKELDNNNKIYYVEKGKTLRVEVDSSAANYISAIKLSGDKLSYEFVEITSNSATLKDCTNGTGTYRIYIGYAEGPKPTTLLQSFAYFDVYVIGNVTGVGSAILVGSR